MNNRTPFPWRHYMRAARIRITFIALACLFTYFAFTLYPEDFFEKQLIVIAFLSLLVFIHGFFRVLPLRHILARVEAIQEQLPHDRKLDLIYQKDEFQLIEEMLNLTEKQLKEQKENYENQLIQSDTILDFIPNAVVIVDKFKNCKLHNLQFESKFIQDKEIKVVDSKKLWKVFDQEDILKAFDLALERKERVSLPGKSFPSLNEWFDVAVTPVLDNKGDVSGALGIFHNVTQSKLNEKMRVDFVANVSHEIRTPLTSIKGYAQLLQAQKESIPASLAPILEKINSNTERLKELFDNLLKLSVIESKHDLKKEAVELAPLLKAVTMQLKGKYLKKDFEIRLKNDASVWADKKLLERALINLADNSIKYSNKEKTFIDVETDESAHSFELRVTDNGRGIPFEEQERIFERFYRSQAVSNTTAEGAGLGLSIVKHIVQKHNGSIKANSSAGNGSTFTIYLPKLKEC